MNTDFRLNISVMGSYKVKKLRRKHGDACFASWIGLLAYAAGSRTDGVLSGMDADDIEAVCDWTGKKGLFVGAMVDCGLLDETDTPGVYALHDWAEHNPWAMGAKDRSEKASKAAIAKRDKTSGGAKTQIEQCSNTNQAVLKPDSSSAKSEIKQCPISISISDTNSNTNTNSESISDSDTSDVEEPECVCGLEDSQELIQPDPRGHHDPVGFDFFIKGYPEPFRDLRTNTGRQMYRDAKTAWDLLRPNGDVQSRMRDKLVSMLSSANWTKDNGNYIWKPVTFIEKRPWESGVVPNRVEPPPRPRFVALSDRDSVGMPV